MKIFETHAHYDDERYDEDRDELISSMLSDTGELDYIVNVGAKPVQGWLRLPFVTCCTI